MTNFLLAIWNTVIGGIVAVFGQLGEWAHLTSEPGDDEGPSPKKRFFISLVAGLAILVSLYSIGTLLFRNHPQPISTPFAALGEITAEETIHFLKGSGRIILLVKDTGQDKVASDDACLGAFLATMERNGHVKIVTILPILFTERSAAAGKELLIDQLLEVLNHCNSIDAIVSLVGGPSLENDDFDRLPRRLPKIISVSPDNDRMEKLIAKNVVQLAIVPVRESVPPPKSMPKTAREWFNLYYQITTTPRPQ